MYNSLQSHCSDFHLYIFAFDDKSEAVLKKMSMENVTVVSLKDFEDEELLKIKPTRSQKEYCWTCTSSTILYCINKFKLDLCFYLDADLLFYSIPKPIIDEMGKNSILLTEHRYTKIYDQTETSGKYCVQFIGFRNDEKGLKALNWWRNSCLEWCYARFENGKFGDQKYLDDWKTRFQGVHELEHLGSGVAPWNVQQYDLIEKNNVFYVKDKKSKNEVELIFYHFHGVVFYSNDIISVNSYYLSNKIRNKLYRNYITELETVKNKIFEIDNSFDPHGSITNYKAIPFSFFQMILFINSQLFKSLKTIIKNILFIDFARSLNSYIHSYPYYYKTKFLLKNIRKN
jgi:hypothetical protein